MADVVLKDVVKQYKSVTAVRNLSIQIDDQEFAIFVGPSGCGKTTVLRMIAGLEEMTSGDIFIGGKRVNDIPPKDRDIAMVFQNYALYPHMNVRENLGFGLKMRHFTRSDIDRRVADAAEILGIHELLDRKPKQLSGGQRQRVAVGRAIVRKPQVFLFDEPLSNLDAKLRVAMRAEISKLHHRLKATIIYVTHDQVEAMTMADRIFIMKDGSLIQLGAPLELFHHPRNTFVAGFIGSPAMNFVDAVIRRDNHALTIDAQSFHLEMPGAMAGAAESYVGKKVILGLRPEFFSVPDKKDRPEGSLALLTARIEVVEPLGSEVYLHLAAGRHRMVAKLEVDNIDFAVDEEVTLAIDRDKTRLFDAETMEIIR